MRYALVAGGIVVNVVLADTKPADGFATDTAGPGWTYAGGVFSPPVQVAQPVRVSKADFQRLLKPSERYRLNALRKVIAGLTPADYADPANALLVAAEDVMFAFEQPLEFIELDHPDTAQGLGLLAYLDVIEPGRIAQIVSNTLPV